MASRSGMNRGIASSTGESWLQPFRRLRQSTRARPPAGPTVFIHVPKTAGTSLTRALLALKPWRHVASEAGNISSTCLDTCAAVPDGERRDLLLHGHAMHRTGIVFGGAAAAGTAFADALTVTVLREPAQHAVSNYLHVRRDPDTPLHALANSLSFEDFLRDVWQFLVFQSISLDVPFHAVPLHSREQFFERVAGVRVTLDGVGVVGTTDDLFSLVNAVARRLRMPPVPVERLNQASGFSVADGDAESLRRRYRALEEDPHLRPLMMAERALFRAARDRADALKRPPAPTGLLAGMLRR